MNTDEALRILSLNSKDATAWDVIAAEVYHPLLAYVASLLLTFRVAPSETADDIVNDVLLSFYKKCLDRTLALNSDAELKAYLRVSSRNLLVDRYRHKRRAEQLLNFLTFKFSDAFKSESNLYRTLFLDEIIKGMPPKCGAMFQLYVTEDLSLAEIADRLGEHPSSVSTRWYRCIRHAKEIFLKRKTALKRL